ncbi:MAG: hypothetical protein ACW99A_02855 [Candidatus Kariarchaeaceae archaeon]|jgi:hypothetical protein
MEQQNLQELIEKLAALEHQQWSHWMRYLLHQKGTKLKSQNNHETILMFSNSDYERWCKQINTLYPSLSEIEKNSDREYAKKVIEIVWKYLAENGLVLAID